MASLKKILVLMGTRHGYAREVLRGAMSYAHEQSDWSVRVMEPLPLTLGTTLRKTMAAIRNWQPNGIIGHLSDPNVYHAIRRLNTPFVHLLDSHGDDLTYRVEIADDEVGKLAAEYLLARGFQHFAFAGVGRLGTSERRRSAFVANLERRGFEVACFSQLRLYDPRQRIAWGDQDARLARWLKGLPKPVALFAMWDPLALEIAELCRCEALSIPQDVALLGVGNDDLFCQLAQPRLSSICLPMRQVGRRAAHILSRLVSQTAGQRRREVLPPGEVITRESTTVLTVDDQLVAEALRVIQHRLTDGINVAEVVAELDISRSLLERRFRRALGRTPLEEILRQRMELVQKLLVDRDIPISQIAQESGFMSAARLSTAFRHRTGQTPAQYRRNRRIQD